MDFFNFSPQKPEEKSNDDKIVQGEIAINPDVVSQDNKQNQETDQPQQDQQNQPQQEEQPQDQQQPEVQTMTSANCKEDICEYACV